MRKDIQVLADDDGMEYALMMDCQSFDGPALLVFKVNYHRHRGAGGDMDGVCLKAYDRRRSGAGMMRHVLTVLRARKLARAMHVFEV
jgi:hypothetical protein